MLLIGGCQVNTLSKMFLKLSFVWFGLWQQLSKFKLQPLRTQIGDDILPSDKLCSLRLNLDNQLTMEARVKNVVRSCSFQLRQLRSIRQCLTIKAVTDFFMHLSFLELIIATLFSSEHLIASIGNFNQCSIQLLG